MASGSMENREERMRRPAGKGGTTALFPLLLLLSLVILPCGCTRDLLTHDAAREAAEAYYTMLITKDYEGFVDGFAYADSMEQDYRSETVDLVRQFMGEGRMPGLCSAQAIADSLCPDSTAYVKLQLLYADSVSEEIELPLLLTNGGWKMK